MKPYREGVEPLPYAIKNDSVFTESFLYGLYIT